MPAVEQIHWQPICQREDLVAGSGITFESLGVRDLKGVPDEWQLYRVTG